LRQDLVGWVVDAIIEDSSGLGLDLLNGWGYVPGNSWHQTVGSTVRSVAIPETLLMARTTTQFGLSGAAPLPAPIFPEIQRSDSQLRRMRELEREISASLRYSSSLYWVMHMGVPLAEGMFRSLQEGFAQIGENMANAQQAMIDAGRLSAVGNTITINGERFVVNTMAEQRVEDMNKRNIDYLLAMRLSDTILVATNPITRDTAEFVIRYHGLIDRVTDRGTYVGVFARNETLAMDLAWSFGGPDRNIENHGPGQIGYWRHIHPAFVPAAHIWYASKL